MKKLFIAIIAVIALGTSAFAAADVNANIASKFQASFVNVSNVSWTISSEYSKATFISNGERMEAYYNNDAVLIAICKAISFERLPAAAQKKIEKNYAGYKLKECIAVDITDENTAYYASFSNDVRNIVLKIEQSGAVSVVKKEKK